MATAACKLALGTVQFGLNYGISNTRGQVPARQVANILDCCRRHGIDTLDTAAAYGESEAILGQALQAAPGYFRLISKTVPASPAHLVPTHFQQSLQKLGLSHLHGYLVHDFPAFEKEPALYNEVLKLRDAGLVEKVGFSLYYPAQLERLLALDLPFQLIQIPFNVFDQRFAYLLPALADRQVEVHVRSVFLQGLFFRDPASLPAFFDPLKAQLQTLQQLSDQARVPLASLLLGFVHLHPQVSKMVIGVTTVEELVENLAYPDYLPRVIPHLDALQNLAVQQEKLVLPFNWNRS